MKRHQNVRRLDVPVDDALLVRVLDRMADLHEQLQSLRRGEVVLVTVVGDADALDQFHHEVRSAGLGDAGVENLGDLWVVHECQGLPLNLETGDDCSSVHAQLDHLERDLSLNGFVLLCSPDHSEATLANLLDQLVGSDSVTRAVHRRRGALRCGLCCYRGSALSFNSLRALEQASCANVAKPLCRKQAATTRAFLQIRHQQLSSGPSYHSIQRKIQRWVAGNLLKVRVSGKQVNDDASGTSLRFHHRDQISQFLLYLRLGGDRLRKFVSDQIAIPSPQPGYPAFDGALAQAEAATDLGVRTVRAFQEHQRQQIERIRLVPGYLALEP